MNAQLKLTAIILLSAFSIAAWAQPTPAQIQMQQHQQQQNMYGAIQSDNMRRCGNPYGCGDNSLKQQLEYKAWKAREQKVQRQIERYRKTPYYGAILFNPPTGEILTTAGQNSEQKSIERAMGRCKTNCRPEIIKTFSNTCAVIVTYGKPRSREDFFVGIDGDDRKAAQKAMNSCETMHGKNSDNCFYNTFLINGKEEPKVCAGYDYGVYSNK